MGDGSFRSDTHSWYVTGTLRINRQHVSMGYGTKGPFAKARFHWFCFLSRIPPPPLRHSCELTARLICVPSETKHLPFYMYNWT